MNKKCSKTHKDNPKNDRLHHYTVIITLITQVTTHTNKKQFDLPETDS